MLTESLCCDKTLLRGWQARTIRGSRVGAEEYQCPIAPSMGGVRRRSQVDMLVASLSCQEQTYKTDVSNRAPGRYENEYNGEEVESKESITMNSIFNEAISASL